MNEYQITVDGVEIVRHEAKSMIFSSTETEHENCITVISVYDKDDILVVPTTTCVQLYKLPEEISIDNLGSIWIGKCNLKEYQPQIIYQQPVIKPTLLEKIYAKCPPVAEFSVNCTKE